MRQLYVLSKAIENKPRLIGVLSEDNGVYHFEYKLGNILPEWFLLLDEFPDVTRVYEGHEVEKFIFRLIPRSDNVYIKELMNTAGLQDYDVWEFLKAFGDKNMRQDAYIYESLPDEVIRYD